MRHGGRDRADPGGHASRLNVRRPPVLARTASLALLVAGLVLPAAAGASPGDVLVADRNFDGAPTYTGAVLRVPGAGGDDRAPDLYQPNGSAIGPDGDLFVTQIRNTGRVDIGEVQRIDPTPAP